MKRNTNCLRQVVKRKHYLFFTEMEKLFPGEIQLFVYDSVDAAWQHPETSEPGNKNISRNKDVLKLQNHRRPYWSLPWKQSENHQLLEFRWRSVGIWKFFTVGIDNGKGQCTFKLVTVSWWEENIWHGTCNSKELPLRFTCSYLPRNSRGQSTFVFCVSAKLFKSVAAKSK